MDYVFFSYFVCHSLRDLGLRYLLLGELNRPLKIDSMFQLAVGILKWLPWPAE